MLLSLTRLTVLWPFQEFGKGGSSVSRCDLLQNLLNEGCKKESVEFSTSSLSINMNVPLSDKASSGDVTQIRPQKIHMTLRPGTFIPMLYKVP